MSVLDKILNFMKLDGDDDFEDDFFDEDEEEEYPSGGGRFEKKRGGLFSKKSGSSRDDFDDDDDDDFGERDSKKFRPKGNSKITPMPASRGSMEIVVVTPTTFDESREVVDTLLTMRSIVLNLEGLDYDVAQRIIDFVCGAAVAVDGTFQGVAGHIFIVTPRTVILSGDVKEVAGKALYEETGYKPRF